MLKNYIKIIIIFNIIKIILIYESLISYIKKLD
ncbi:MAG: hypothetical protein QG635_1680 [Bacteroidota bacterium]|nr:hypothetical protein [Bacteroidota bacterium]